MSFVLLSWVIIVTVILGLLTIAAIVGTILFLAGREGSGVRRVGRALSLVCGTLVAFVVALGVTSMGVVYLAQQDRDVAYPSEESTNSDVIVLPMPIQQPVYVKPPENERVALHPGRDGIDVPRQKSALEVKGVEPGAAVTPQDDRTARGESASERPEWTHQPQIHDGDAARLVLTSKQFATIEEAREEIAATAKEMLRQDFERIYRVTAPAIGDLPTNAVRDLAVRQEFVETIERDFGNFYAPMHRVWWQLEISPEVRNNLFPVWKTRTQEQRMLAVAGSLVAATIGLAGISFLFRRRTPSPPPAPPVKKSSAVVLGIGAAALAVKHCRNWWHSLRSCR
jgi:hypothetical protein